MAIVEAGLGEVRVVDELRRVLVEVGVGLGLGRAPVPEGVVEPDLVLQIGPPIDGLTSQIFWITSTLVSVLLGLNVLLPLRFERVQG